MPLELVVAGDERRVSHSKVISSVSGEYLFFTAVLEADGLVISLASRITDSSALPW